MLLMLMYQQLAIGLSVAGISATAAIRLESHERLIGVITKEQMRPDVSDWFGV